MSIENKLTTASKSDIILDNGPFYHGTKADLKIGNLIKIGFPSNSRSYRTAFPLKVIGEITEWKGHSQEELKNMKDNLNKLKEQGIEAINE